MKQETSNNLAYNNVLIITVLKQNYSKGKGKIIYIYLCVKKNMESLVIQTQTD